MNTASIEVPIEGSPRYGFGPDQGFVFPASGTWTITISGTGLQAGASLSSLPTGLSVSGTPTTVTNGRMTVVLVAAADAPLGAGTVTLVNPDGGSATFAITVLSASSSVPAPELYVCHSVRSPSSPSWAATGTTPAETASDTAMAAVMSVRFIWELNLLLAPGHGGPGWLVLTHRWVTR